MPKVIVGMSGGVDSAVAAYLLKKQGYEVIGVMLRTWVSDTGEESRCCEINDARESARIIGIPFHAFNCVSEFEQKIVRSFMEAYLHGMTPNPCVLCNREIKWERLLHYADILQAEYVATGHYAVIEQLENGRYTVRKAAHAEKDQTYMLYRLTQEQLKRTLMPLGSYSKQEVRKIAKEIGLPVYDKPDSQEICFVTDGNYADFIQAHADGEIPGEGNYVDENGRILGKHKGIIHYTVGQRKRLGIALGRPAYIKRICPEKNEIVLSTANEIRCSEVFVRDLSFMSSTAPGDGETLPCQAKVRYRHAGQSALLTRAAEDRFRLRFEEPVRFAAPGQSVVFYDDADRVMGGGIIDEVIFEEGNGRTEDGNH